MRSMHRVKVYCDAKMHCTALVSVLTWLNI
jgi:hypothetical protein